MDAWQLAEVLDDMKRVHPSPPSHEQTSREIFTKGENGCATMGVENKRAAEALATPATTLTTSAHERCFRG
jgi:hypothetical protein